MTREVCQRVFGIICDQSGDADIPVRLFDEVLVSEGEFESVSVPFFVVVARSRVVARVAVSVSAKGAASVRAAARGRTGAGRA